MPVLGWIVVATLLGGILSVVGAAAFALRARPAQVPMLISFAIGTVLGAAFLEILPHAVELSPSPERVTGTVLIGILLFFVLEKLYAVAAQPWPRTAGARSAARRQR